MKLNVYEETPYWQVNEYDVESVKFDHCYIGNDRMSARNGKFSEAKNISDPSLNQQEILALKVYLLEVENSSLTKNLRALEKDYVRAMKSKVSTKA